MQINIAPKLESIIKQSFSAPGDHGCDVGSHNDIVDALKLVYGGIQNICTALLDENQFAQPEFPFSFPDQISPEPQHLLENKSICESNNNISHIKHISAALIHNHKPKIMTKSIEDGPPKKLTMPKENVLPTLPILQQNGTSKWNGTSKLVIDDLDKYSRINKPLRSPVEN